MSTLVNLNNLSTLTLIKRITELEAKLSDAKQVARYEADVASQAIADFEAVKAQLAATAWQPIETAPKEGEFLVFMPTNRTPIQHCSAHKNVTIIGNCFAFDLPKPTHWMPLPKMPIDAAMQPNGQP